MTSPNESVIRWEENSSFDIDINLSLRKGGIESITYYEDYLRIRFMNGTGLSIQHPDNLDNLISDMEKELTNWHGYYEGYGLQGYIINRIIIYIKDHFKEIKEAIEKTKTS